MSVGVPMNQEDPVLEVGEGSRKEQRANARNQLKEVLNELQQAGRRIVNVQVEICEAFGFTPSKESAAAFSDLFVAMEHAYETVEDQLNNDLAAEQRQEGAKQ